MDVSYSPQTATAPAHTAATLHSQLTSIPSQLKGKRHGLLFPFSDEAPFSSQPSLQQGETFLLSIRALKNDSTRVFFSEKKKKKRLASIGGKREVGHFGRTKRDEKELFLGFSFRVGSLGTRGDRKRKREQLDFVFFSSQEERKDLYFSAKRERGMLKARRGEDKLFV